MFEKSRYRGTRQKIRVEKTGERVIVDPGATVQRIFMVRIPPSLPWSFFFGKKEKISTKMD